MTAPHLGAGREGDKRDLESNDGCDVQTSTRAPGPRPDDGTGEAAPGSTENNWSLAYAAVHKYGAEALLMVRHA